MTTAAPKISHIYNPANMSPQELIDNFVVRQSLFQRLFEALKTAPMEQPEQHYIVVGPRGSGKSTLLQRLYYEVQRDPDLSQRVIPILFPEEQYQIVSLARLWENVLEELDRKPGFAGVYRDFEAGLAGVEGGDEEEYAFERLDQALQARSRKAILFLENIGDLLARFSDQEHQRLRERLLTCADLRIVGGSAVVLEHTYCYSQPLFDFFQFEYLRELNQQEIYALLASLARRYNEEHVARILREQPERVEILRRLTGGIPRTIVLLFEIFAESEDGDSFKDLEQVLDLVTPLYKHRMEEGLTPARQQIIDCVAMNWDALTVPEIASKLRIAVTDGPKRDALVIDVEELVKNSLLQRVSEPAPEPLYQIAERFFNIWYLMRHGRHGDRNRVRWFVRFLEAWCSPQDLEARARKHLSMLQTQNVDPQYAVNVTQALANTRLDSELQDSLIRSTRSLLELKDASLLDDLSPSDNELFADSERAYKAHQFAQALSLLKQIANPSGSTFGGWALCCQGIQDYDAAEQYYKQSLDADPDHAVNLCNYASFLAYQRLDFEVAEQYYKQALAVDPNHSNNLCTYALFLKYARHDYDAAEQYYKRALEADPNDANTLCNYAIFLVEQRHNDEAAEQYFKQALKADPDDANNLYNYAVFLVEQRQDYDVAEQYYKRALEADPNDANTLCNYAVLLEVIHNDYDQAEHLYRRAIELGNSRAIDRLVSMCFTQGRSRETALEYSTLLTEPSSGPAQQFRHAAILVWNRRREEAIALVNTVLQANTELEPLDELRDVLLMLIAAQAYEEAWTLFSEPTYKLKDRYWPVYYALLYFVRERHRSEYQRMGSELKETVEELVERIKQWRQTYFPEG